MLKVAFPSIVVHGMASTPDKLSSAAAATDASAKTMRFILLFYARYINIPYMGRRAGPTFTPIGGLPRRHVCKTPPAGSQYMVVNMASNGPSGMKVYQPLQQCHNTWWLIWLQTVHPG